MLFQVEYVMGIVMLPTGGLEHPISRLAISILFKFSLDSSGIPQKIGRNGFEVVWR